MEREAWGRFLVPPASMIIPESALGSLSAGRPPGALGPPRRQSTCPGATLPGLHIPLGTVVSCCRFGPHDPLPAGRGPPLPVLFRAPLIRPTPGSRSRRGRRSVKARPSAVLHRTPPGYADRHGSMPTPGFPFGIPD